LVIKISYILQCRIANSFLQINRGFRLFSTTWNKSHW